MIYIWQKHAPFVIKSVHRRHSPPGETVQLMRIHPGRPEASQPASQPADTRRPIDQPRHNHLAQRPDIQTYY